jgi:hypothetical protein
MVTDSDLASDTDNQQVTVTVLNVAPTAVLGNSGPVAEGSAGSVSFSGQFDPSAGDTATGFSYSYDFNNDGDFTDPGDVAGSTSASGSIPAGLLADGPASFTVRARIADRDGDFTDYTTVVTVTNVEPVVTLTGDGAVNEGLSRTYSFTVVDPGADSFVLGETSCGTGGVQVGSDVFDSVTGAGSFVCSFPDGPAGPVVSVTVSDDDGASDSDTRTVTVTNVAPSIVLTGVASVNEAVTETYSYTVTDPGLDTHTVVTGCGGNGIKVTGSDLFDQATGQGSV